MCGVSTASKAEKQIQQDEIIGQLMGSSIQRENRKRDDKSERLPPDWLLTPGDVAALTGLSVETLAQWRSQKRGIPFVKISRNCVRYRQCDFDNWIAGRIVRVDVEPSNATGRA